jgi:hypothetical protein
MTSVFIGPVQSAQQVSATLDELARRTVVEARESCDGIHEP